MAKREFLQLAHTFDPAKAFVPGWFLSEKLDGMRAFWDGGITRGIPAALVPWANIEKDFRLLEPVQATGLWSRYGKVIRAPDFWLDKLPKQFLDGELYLGRGQFQSLVSITKRHDAGIAWMGVQYRAFDFPSLAILADGEIKNTNFKKKFKGCVEWAKAHHSVSADLGDGFASRLKAIPHQWFHPHERLPFHPKEAMERVHQYFDELLDLGGEGVMLKKPSALYQPERSHDMLKYKPWHDAEATVRGYIWGEQTDKGSKLAGLMGALVLHTAAGEFKISGFTDDERRLVHGTDGTDAAGFWQPGAPVQPGIVSKHFPIGSVITYKYRELTDAGLPKEARYLRKRVD